jgi:serine/threonine protein kinase/Tol biopolymer transport system component
MLSTPLTQGTRLGRYEIKEQLGAGGMGEVYLAHDTQLDRDIALKILTADVASNQERMRRFIQEAKAASALSHPNVAHIYEVGEMNSLAFIAMEYVEGVTLREHEHNTRMKLSEALNIATQIADALAAAHAVGIVHRDIKPENVMVRADGYIKVLDFGLAKLTNPQESMIDSEMATRALINTSPGVVMGTVSYMSPEQARGLKLDARTDIWSLGVVLYEMVTGSVPFKGETPTDVIISIAEREPQPLTRLAPDAPSALEWIVKKALAKNKDERYQTVKDLQIDLRRLKQDVEFEERGRSVAPHAGESAPVTISAGQTAVESGAQARASQTETITARSTSSTEIIVSEIKRHKTGAALIIAALAIAVAGVAYGLYKFVGRKSAAGLQSMKITKLTNSGKVGAASISPDGKYVAYSASDEAGQSSLWVIHVATTSNVQVVPPAGIDVQFTDAAFSLDGNYIYYVRAEKSAPPVLYQVPVLGGTSKRLLEGVGGPIGFSPDGKRFAFYRRYASQGEDALMLANADGTGEQRLATRAFPDFFLGGAAWSPDGKTIACGFGSFTGGYYRSVAVIQVADGTQKTLTSHKWFNVERVAWLSDGSGVVTTAQEQSGSPFQIWQISYPEGEAHTITNDLNAYHNASLTADSSALVTVLADTTSNVWAAPTGEWAGARQLTSGKENGGSEGGTTWTPDGKIVYRSRAGGNPDIWIMDADGHNQKQLTDDAYYERSPSVTPDGRYVVFDSSRSGTQQLWRVDIDGSNLKQLTTGTGAFTPNCSPDGKWVVYGSFGSSGFIIWKVSIDGGEPVQVTNKFAYLPAISPDGKLIACYLLDQQTRVTKIALLPFEGGDPVKLFDLPQTANRVESVRWTPDGRGVTYINTRGIVSNIWLQPIDGGPPKQLTDFKTDRIFSFDWSRDGKWLACSRGVVDSDVVLIKDFK